MCGIAGILGSRLQPHELEQRLLAMRSRLRHRGPDDAGAFYHREAGVALGHTRLAILDLSEGGHQPMPSLDGRFVIVFNGEIYNFRALKCELEQQGETFRTQSDTEVLLKLYQREGAACVEKLAGMFAFAVWDRQDETCFLARDPLGIKPLYVWREGTSLAFASELQALLAADLGAKKVCASALHEYLLYGSVQEPCTLLDKIELLPAGHSLLWRQGQGHPQRYWQLEFTAELSEPHEAVAATRAALVDSIRRHFVSDVPVGIFLSGGLDSAAIVALAKVCGFAQPETLCISFEGPDFNEGPQAIQTANHFATKHHEWRMTAQDGKNLFSDFLQRVDQPSVDGFNTFCVAKFAHDLGLKVVLSGVGGDELFGSYNSFRMVPKLVTWHRRLGAVRSLQQALGTTCERLGRQQRMRRFGTFLRSPGNVDEAYWAVRGIFSPGEACQISRALLGDGAVVGANVGRANDFFIPQQPTLADEISYLEIMRYMRNQLLRDSDVMSMAWGLELRTPLVDRKLVDTIRRVPAQRRLGRGKRLLLDAVPEIPAFVANRSKRGFSFPFERWIRTEWQDVFAEVATVVTPQAMTWYRGWCVYMLIHFLRRCGLDLNIDSGTQQRATEYAFSGFQPPPRRG